MLSIVSSYLIGLEGPAPDHEASINLAKKEDQYTFLTGNRIDLVPEYLKAVRVRIRV
jgi:hypothetical protein